MPTLFQEICGSLVGVFAAYVAYLAIRPPARARADSGTRLICVGASASSFALALEIIFPFTAESHGTRVVNIAVAAVLLVVGQVCVQAGIQMRARRARRKAVIEAQAGRADGARG